MVVIVDELSVERHVQLSCQKRVSTICIFLVCASRFYKMRARLTSFY